MPYLSVRLLMASISLVICSACGGGGGGGGGVAEDRDQVVNLGNVAFWSFDNMVGPNAPNTKFAGTEAVLNLASVVPGRVGNGVRFDASVPHSYAEIAGFKSSMTGGSDIQATFPDGRISIALWVNPEQIGSPSNYQLFGGGYEGIQSFFLQLIDGKVAFLLESSDNSRNEVASSTSTLTTGTWTHIAVTYDGISARIYLNGALDSSTNVAHVVKQVPNSLYIGGRGFSVLGTGGVTTFPGTIDEVLLAQKTLTNQEVLQLASGVAP